MMPKLTKPQFAILEIIARHNGDWNWYQVARAAFDIMTDNPDIKTSDFVADGLVSETKIEGEPLPKLSLTPKGSAELSLWRDANFPVR